MIYKTLLLFVILLFSCNSENKKSKGKSKMNNSSDSVVIINSPKTIKTDKELHSLKGVGETVDLNMDISKLNLFEIRILRNSFAAKQGYCFMKADLRAYFSTTSWYLEKMEERFWKEDSQEEIAPISYSKEQQKFINKLLKREQELKEKNLYQKDGKTHPNLDNIINLFQLEDQNPQLMQMLSKNGFAIVPNNNIQLFHVYEQNDYQQFPNFVTTDMYMQLFHMYFGFILRTVEEEKFIPITADLCLTMINEMKAISKSKESLKELAEYNETFYAIAYTILTDKKVTVPISYETLYNEELNHVNKATDNVSEFLDYTSVKFPYSLFKPRGHYTRTESLKRYFKAMMWLQTAPYCLDNDIHLQRAILSASVLSENVDSIKNYRALMEPISFIIGEPDNVSFLNLVEIYNRNYNLNEVILNPTTFESFRSEVKTVASKLNKIKPENGSSCIDKINFIPQRYLADNEILSGLVDLESDKSLRAYPKGLDVMAAFGSNSAESLLIKELNEKENWDKYPKILNSLKSKMTNEVDWNATLYNKWIKSLLDLQKPNNDYPYFMQSTQWHKKDLNASLASWAELKHDAILYAEQPMAAECGGGGPPAPYTLGYVEPNINYWNTVIKLIDLTESVLTRNNLVNKSISGATTKMKENAQFLLSASKKELAGEKLSEKEYSQIELIGSTFEWITLDFVKQEDEYLDGWSNVKGPDKSVAVIADIYTANSKNNPDKGILHVGTGNVNDIYVLVEIEGYLYLTKGAVFSYHEFHTPLDTRLTDEEWQKMLESDNADKQPEWIKEIIVPIEPPKTNEKIFYSSGC